MIMANPTTFWDTLPRPIIALAPMDGVTDHPFRHIQKKYGNPMLVYTEFTSVEGICRGDGRLMRDFLYDESQRPIIAQIYGHTPDCFRQSAIAMCQLGFDGIDINMGCPAKNITHRGAGAGLIKTPALAQTIIRATKQGVTEWQNGATVRDCPDIQPFIVEEIVARHQQLPAPYQRPRAVPVSVKTRIGFDAPAIEAWLPHLLACAPAAIAIHGRTLTQGYSGDADWEQIGIAATIARGTGTLILGNGDVHSFTDAQERVAAYGVDGVLIGRGSYGNPFIFKPENGYTKNNGYANNNGAAPVDDYRRLHIALEHARLYEASFRAYGRYHFPPMRKHLRWYAHDMPGARYLRRDLSQSSSVEEVVEILDRYYVYRQQRLAGASD